MEWVPALNWDVGVAMFESTEWSRSRSAEAGVDVDRQLFDLGKLSCRIDELIEERGVTVAALARKVGMAASTIRRFKTAEDAEADGVLGLIAWTGDTPEQFIAESAVVGRPLPPAGTDQIPALL